MQLKNMQGPLASLNMASHIIYRYTRVRAVAFAFVSAVRAEGSRGSVPHRGAQLQ